MIGIIPTIFEKDWDAIERKVAIVAPYVDWLQIDIADGSLVPAETFLDLAKFGQLVKPVSFEAHLMVASPEKYIRMLVDAGFKRLIAHVEANDPRLFLDETEKESVEVGLAIDGATEVEAVEPFLETIDVVLVMMAEMGARGLTLQPENVEKIRAIHQAYPDLTIAAEEGISESSAKMIVDAGATRLIISDPAIIPRLKML